MSGERAPKNVVQGQWGAAGRAGGLGKVRVKVSRRAFGLVPRDGNSVILLS